MNEKRFNEGACHGTIYERFRQSDALKDSEPAKGSLYAKMKLTRLRLNPDNGRNYHTERFGVGDLPDLKKVVDDMLSGSEKQIEDMNNWNRERHGRASPSAHDDAGVSIQGEFKDKVYVSGPIKAVQKNDPNTGETQIQFKCKRKTFTTALLPNVSRVLEALINDKQESGELKNTHDMA